ncbi:Flavin-containing monooxygenase FMO GS-OX3 [Frankliniella fusca]|uniref:Flavin-containing monooxygenase FMO GS-OX3 n=1 Tax=Frankliniella fusca TaxID=407009 RepID=A0AAE1LN45_9NEOP|nr:Flavin-containing monooxygenase FMO GS-OX3 [Frankliniella fusca]
MLVGEANSNPPYWMYGVSSLENRLPNNKNCLWKRLKLFIGKMKLFDSTGPSGSTKFILEEDEKNSNEAKTVYRANLKTKEDAEDWLKEYKAASQTEWIVKDEPKCLQKLEFHKYWLCHLSKRNKTEQSKRNKVCTVKLDIKIKKLNRFTIRNDRNYLERDVPLPAVITITNDHSHPTKGCFETLGYLRISEETIEILYKYFDEGLSPGAAYRLNDLSLKLRPNSGELRANSSINPTSRMVQHIFNSWRNSEFGQSWGSDPFPKLKEKMPAYEAEGTSICIDDTDSDCWAVLVVTPIMKRAQELSSSGEIIFTDSTSNVEFTQSVFTLMLTATKGGAVPVAVLIHTGTSTASYIKAYKLLKENYPNCFGGKDSPGIFMTDHSDAEKGALKAVWPQSLQYLCHFHIGQSEWRWLKNSKHKVPQECQQGLMKILQNIMYAESTEQFEEATEALENCSQANYIYHLQVDLLPIKEQWVKMFRHDIISRGHETNNYAEANIRVLKDIVLTRTKAFNVTAMVDFTVRIWEPYFESRLLRYAYGRVSGPQLRFEELSSKMPPDSITKVKHIEDDLYHVPSGNPSTPDLTYEVESTIGWCSCPVGRCGALCKHQALIYEHYGGVFPNMPAINCVGRHELGKLALGNQCPPFSFFVAVGEKVPEEFQALLDAPQVQNTSTATVNAYATSEQEPQQDISSDPTEERMEDIESSDKSIEEVIQDLILEIKRVTLLGIKSASELGSYRRSLQRLVQKLQRVKTPGQATLTVISLNARANCTSKKGSRINVQPTAPGRRVNGSSGRSRQPAGRPKSKQATENRSTQGCSRVSAGRPPSQLPEAKRSKKPKHSLSLSINKNKGHAKSHGH